ncbi:hypothetical protein GCM10022207_79700 [Streptomyces lannensis]|uniref:Uncharacterized protein n=1 Tax=Streptomyces lannensis TaxID=766498 RepID=A0ABP7LE74_9ACTN
MTTPADGHPAGASTRPLPPRPASVLTRGGAVYVCSYMDPVERDDAARPATSGLPVEIPQNVEGSAVRSAQVKAPICTAEAKRTI